MAGSIPSEGTYPDSGLIPSRPIDVSLLSLPLLKNQFKKFKKRQIFYVNIYIRKLLSFTHICKQFAVSIKKFLQIQIWKWSISLQTWTPRKLSSLLWICKEPPATVRWQFGVAVVSVLSTTGILLGMLTHPGMAQLCKVFKASSYPWLIWDSQHW